MIVEFCDASGPDGLFRKYAAFKVGPHIIPSHVFSSHEWTREVANGTSRLSTACARGCSSSTRIPMAPGSRRVFDLAGIDYGRIDYGVAGGVPQVWEINLNATLGRAEGQSRHTGLDPALKALRDSGRDIFHAQLRSAFLALDAYPPGAVERRSSTGRCRRGCASDARRPPAARSGSPAGWSGSTTIRSVNRPVEALLFAAAPPLTRHGAAKNAAAQYLANRLNAGSLLIRTAASGPPGPGARASRCW